MRLNLILKLGRSCWHTTSMRFYCLSMILAVTAMTAVCIFSNRVSLALHEQAISAVGGDIQLNSHSPIPQQLRTLATQYNLQTTNTAETQTVLLINDRVQLAKLKAVADNYPLVGNIHLKYHTGNPITITSAPKSGEVWLDQRLLESLGLEIGNNLDIGNKTFTIAAALLSMPDTGNDPFAISPVALINLQDLAATELILPGSRAKYRLMLSGNNGDAFLSAATPIINEAIQIIHPNTNESRAMRISEQGLLFLRLGSLCALLMAAVAIGLTTHLYVQHEIQTVAVLRSFGMKLYEVLSLYCIMFLVLATCCAVVGIALGSSLQALLAFWLAQVSPISLPAPNLWPFLLGLVTAWVLVLGLTIPALLRYHAVSPKSLLAAQIPAVPINTGITLIFGLSAIYTVMALLTQNLGVANLFLLATAMVVAMIGLVVLVVILILARMRKVFTISLRLIIGRIAKKMGGSLPQLIASTIAIGLFLTLTLLGNRLLSIWNEQIPAGTPNFFAYNINPDQAADFKSHLTRNNIPHSQLYPIVRGRINALNDQEVETLYTTNGRPNVLRRALNLTWSDTIPNNNKVIAGRWFNKHDQGKLVISIEQGMATQLSVGIGDTLSFRIADQDLTATIISIRSLMWDSFNPNFFVIFPPQTLDHYPATGVISFYLDHHMQSVAINKLFPTVTLLDIGAILERIQSVVLQLQKSIGLLQLLTLVTTCLVLLIIVLATLRERLEEIAILKTFGVSNKQLRQQWLGEMGLLGILSGGLASLFALYLEYRLSVYTFNIEYQFNSGMLIMGVLLGLMLHLMVGVWGLKRVVAASPAVLFRDL